MDKTELRTLRILEAISDNDGMSQRRLANRLGISLGLVNSFVKRLAAKGYFKVVNIPSNRVRYILTPTGFAEKARLSYNYINYSFQFYKNARHNLRNLFSSLEVQGVRRVVFYGVTDFAEIAYLSLREVNIHLLAVVGDGGKRETFFEHRIIATDKLSGLGFDRIIITDLENRAEIMETMLRFGLDREVIVLPN